MPGSSREHRVTFFGCPRKLPLRSLCALYRLPILEVVVLVFVHPVAGHVARRDVRQNVAPGVVGAGDVPHVRSLLGDFAVLGWHYLSNATCLLRPRWFYVSFYSVKDHRDLPFCAPLLKSTCVGQVVLDKIVPPPATVYDN